MIRNHFARLREHPESAADSEVSNNSMWTEPKNVYEQHKHENRSKDNEASWFMLLQFASVLSQIQIKIAVPIYTTTAFDYKGQCLRGWRLRPLASPCARWCRRHQRAAPTRSGFSRRCYMAPHTRQLSVVSLTAEICSCLWDSRTPRSGSQLQTHKGIWNVIQFKTYFGTTKQQTGER